MFETQGIRQAILTGSFPAAIRWIATDGLRRGSLSRAARLCADETTLKFVCFVGIASERIFSLEPHRHDDVVEGVLVLGLKDTGTLIVGQTKQNA